MLQYKNHRFYWGEVSFEIPDGFYLNNAPEFEAQTGVFLISPDGAYYLDITICDDASVSAREELASTVRDFTVLAPVSEIAVNGLHGYHAAYCTKTDQYYEVQLDIPVGIMNLQFRSEGKSILEMKEQIDLSTIIFPA